MIRPPGVPRGRPFYAGEGSSTLLRERLGAFQTAFRTDTRPGLVFERGRLTLANEAAKRLLRPSAATSGFLEALKVGLATGRQASGLHLEADSGRFFVELQLVRSRAVHTTRICYLIKEAAIVPALRSLTDRELGVLTWLVKGSTNGQIATRLGISIETVRKHVSQSLKKTGTKTRAGLVGRALGR
jgi:DNA-binding CsgD family transcriptional regulator